MPAPITRTAVIDCDCSSFTRPHGTQHGYQYHGCGCEPCRQAYGAYLRSIRARKAQGDGAYVPVAPVRDRLHSLMQRGVPIRLVAERLGYAPSTLYSISRAQRPTCRREVAEAVMAHPLPSVHSAVRKVNRKAAR